MSGNREEMAHQERGWSALYSYVNSHKLEMGLWLTRLMTHYFSLVYFFPFLPFSSDPLACYYKAFMANAATSALRLHQRIPSVSFSRAFLTNLLMEDSAHYLIFSLIFLFVQPVTMAILPIFLFATLHIASFSIIMLDQSGINKNWWIAHFLVALVEQHSRTIFRMAAFVEILLMPTVVFLIFSGRTSIVTPFLYYRFLVLRYSSRRNPYNRAMFHELRLVMEETAASNKCPAIIRVLTHKAINYISSLDPGQAHQN